MKHIKLYENFNVNEAEEILSDALKEKALSLFEKFLAKKNRRGHISLTS